MVAVEDMVEAWIEAEEIMVVVEEVVIQLKSQIYFYNITLRCVYGLIHVNLMLVMINMSSVNIYNM